MQKENNINNTGEKVKHTLLALNNTIVRYSTGRGLIYSVEKRLEIGLQQLPIRLLFTERQSGIL
jgi:hypothetical protein